MLKVVIAAAVAVVVLTSLTLYTPVMGRHVFTKSDLCPTCNVSHLTVDTFKQRYLGACLVCGEFYGSEIEHCCMCHERWFDDCYIATAGDLVLPAEVEKLDI